MTRAVLACFFLCTWNLVTEAQEADAMTMPLAAAGDPAIGRAIFSDRESGHCVLCHQVDGLEVPFQGNLGPADDAPFPDDDDDGPLFQMDTED